MWQIRDNRNNNAITRNEWAQSLFGKTFFELNRKESRIVNRKIYGKKSIFKL